MNIGGRRSRIGWTAAAMVAGTVIGVTGCQPTPTAASSQSSRPAVSDTDGGGTEVKAMSGALTSARQPAGPGGACVFVKPDGAQKFGHVGWGFRVTGTNQWVYGAVENPSNKLYTPPGGYIGAWHAQGSYDRMLSEMSRDAHYPGKSTHPYSRYRCVSSSTSDVNRAWAMIRTVESRGFLVGVDPKTGDLTSRDCLDATYDVLHAYRTRHLTYAPHLDIPNVWVETLWNWSDHTLRPH
ncbi:hypothetical protein ABZ848_47730 [Streptomyces sp. NPDC047081]|uniref:hypothetical protein n=1 Tax=Streptomyces sp. NPDC047081 TaxID=3154706 RepID=UPI0034012239